MACLDLCLTANLFHLFQHCYVPVEVLGVDRFVLRHQRLAVAKHVANRVEAMQRCVDRITLVAVVTRVFNVDQATLRPDAEASEVAEFMTAKRTVDMSIHTLQRQKLLLR